MPILADHIKVLPRFARSANLERDAAQAEPLHGYVVTARAYEAVERVLRTAATRRSGGAWSLTGPYGSGKSSLALFLNALLGPGGDLRDAATESLADANPDASHLPSAAHSNHGTQADGFHRALVTAAREPLIRTVLRGLHRAVLEAYGEVPTTSDFAAADALQTALDDAASKDPRRTGPSPATLVQVAKCLAEDRPLLLVIDEFGKNLEAIGHSSDADPYLLQQLAEAGQGSGLPLFVITLQHLSFEDYLSHTEVAQRREWAKIQGRFESIPYTESFGQTRALIGTAFQVDDLMRAHIGSWARVQAQAMRLLGLPEFADADMVASWYPLHPLVAAVLPELCNRYGQHERTLFSFLTGAESASATSYMLRTQLPTHGSLPSVGLATVYDYFVANSTTMRSAGDRGRWMEIATRLRDAPNLTETQQRLAKAIAILNLVSTTGVLRASPSVLREVEPRADNTLSELEAEGIVTYRDYADEYRIWQGTGVDIPRLLDLARTRVQRRSLVDILTDIDDPRPMVAARHSAENNILRVFCRRYHDRSGSVEPLTPFSDYDGEVLLFVGSGEPPRLANSSRAAKPVVAAIPADLDRFDEAAREVAAVRAVLAEAAVNDDWVARRELAERLAQAQREFEQATVLAFHDTNCRWTLLGSEGATDLVGGRGSAALSRACDLVYHSTPQVRNEILNRTKVTSQGAKARRILLEGMIERDTLPNLGLAGYGPEVAMYRAFLAEAGLHQLDPQTSTWGFRRPTDEKLQDAWEVLEAELQRATRRRVNLSDVYAALLSPPVGMKRGVIPVFVTAALITRSEDIALYEHGTFAPVLTPELSERMVRNPGHFEVKHFANTTGARLQVVEALARRLDVLPALARFRVENVLTIVGQLVGRARRLDNFTRQTLTLKAETVAVRDALFKAVEPDQLLFQDLPRALGLPVVSASKGGYPSADVLADKLARAMDELSWRHDELLAQLLEELFEESLETSRLAISGQAKALEDEVLNPAVRAFVLTLANETVDTDADWIAAIATVVAGKAPSEWRDADLDRFGPVLSRQVTAFQRLVALHVDRRAHGGGPFKTFRLTLTRPDGSEHVGLIGVDDKYQQFVSDVLDTSLGKLVAKMGSEKRALSALMAMMAERVLPAPDEASDDTTYEFTTDRAQNA